MLDVQRLENCYLEVADTFSESAAGSFINLEELVIALEQYFNGTLDDVDEYLSRLWMPVEKLIPDRTLLSVLDSSLMREALMELPLEYRAAIRAYWGDSSVGYRQLADVLPPGIKLVDLHSIYLTEAINQLARILYQKL
jgi:hypothetical protein